jgi:predicted kinase
MSDTASNASRETARTRATSTTASSFNIHLNKPILKATPPSSSRQRSPSPTRNVLNTLKHAVHLCESPSQMPDCSSHRR